MLTQMPKISQNLASWAVASWVVASWAVARCPYTTLDRGRELSGHLTAISWGGYFGVLRTSWRGPPHMVQRQLCDPVTS